MDEVSITQAMQLAIEAGRKGLGFVHSNPAVGCVILGSSGEVLSVGYHQRFGGPHAEIDALTKIEKERDLVGATFVVTLEPCAHEGKTPSCAKRLAELPVRRVIYGLQDPNPLVAGKGAEMLRRAGIRAELFSGPKNVQEDLEDLAEIFLWQQRKKSCFVALKAATSANGSIVSGTENPWITSRESREHVHFLRSQYDAVLVGVETFIKDNPRLDVRIPDGSRENIVVVLDPQGRGLQSLPGSSLFQVRSRDKIIWVVREGLGISSDLGIQIEQMPVKPNGPFDLKLLLRKCHSLGVGSIFVEGGARVYGEFLNQSLVNRVYHYQAPQIVPEEKVLHWLSHFKGSLPVQWSRSQVLGPDQFFSLRLDRQF